MSDAIRLIPVPRGMSPGFYAFMSAGCSRSDDGQILMIGDKMSDQQKTPLPGEWWETRGGERWHVVQCADSIFLRSTQIMPLGTRLHKWRTLDEVELTRHLPACTGWDWEEKNDG